jgi:glutaredoxin
MTEKLILYQRDMCGYCEAVKDVIFELGADIEQRNIWENRDWQRQLVEARGSSSVPVLCRETPDGEVEWLAESDAIIRYLIQNCDSTN